MLCCALRIVLVMPVVYLLKAILGCWALLYLLWEGLSYLWNLKVMGSSKSYLQSLKLKRLPSNICFAFQYGEAPSPDDLACLADWCEWLQVPTVSFYVHTLDTKRYTWRLRSKAALFNKLEVVGHSAYVIQMASLVLKQQQASRETLASASGCEFVISLGNNVGMPLCGLGISYTALSELEYGGRFSLFTPLRFARALQIYAKSHQRLGK